MIRYHCPRGRLGTMSLRTDRRDRSFAIAIAAGSLATRVGLALSVALCILSLALIAFVEATPATGGRVARGCATARVDRAVVVTPSNIAWKGIGFDTPLPIYQAGLRQISETGAAVRELDILAVRAAGAALPRQLLRAPNGTFRLVERDNDDTFTLVRFASPRPVHVTRTAIRASHFGDWPPQRVTVFIQHARPAGVSEERDSAVSGRGAACRLELEQEPCHSVLPSVVGWDRTASRAYDTGEKSRYGGFRSGRGARSDGIDGGCRPVPD
jgi:hypothetical protein